MDLPLEGRVCVVTGATGIAAATALRCAAQGGSVFVISLDGGEAERVSDRIVAEGGRSGWAAADLRSEGQADAAFTAAAGWSGRIDGLVAVAGGSGRGAGDGPLHEVSLDAWQATFDLNGLPAFLAVRSTLRAMLAQGTGGSIAIVTSAIASHPSPALFATHAYAAAKGAAISLMLATAAYYAGDGIRVNAIAPGLVDTPMATRALSDPATTAYAAVKQPLARGPLDPRDVAEVAAFLMSDAAAMVTGQLIAVDGGWGVSEPPPPSP
jgi:NAD(P)-dependent dehydrogenase (short-subunit alcohol dehydrogenase family)